MKRYITENNVVVNVVELEDNATWTPPVGCILEPKTYQPPAPVAVTIRDFKNEFLAATTETAKINLIAESLGLKD